MTTFQRAIYDRMRADPEALAVECGEERTTRAQLVARAAVMAEAFCGVAPGDLVTIALPNGPDFFAAFVACWMKGATPQPVSAAMPLVEREAVIAAARSTLVVHLPGASSTGAPGLDVSTVPAVGAEPSGADLDRVVASWKAPTSGGSTGVPKVIVDVTSNEIDLGAPDLWRWGVNGTQVVPCPLYHNAPLYHAVHGLARGNAIVLSRRFDAEQTLAQIAAYRAHWLILVPTMMQRIMRLPEEVRLSYDVSSLRFLLHTAAACPVWLKRAWIDWIGAENVCELYGSTENTATTCIWGDEWLAHSGSVGRPLAGEITVTDEHGSPSPPGEIGEIWMRSPAPTFHYRGAEPRMRDGWQSMGDLGWLAADGFLFVADRRLDMIVTGGHNVFPAEVEAALDAHPDVAGSVVVGLPDDDLGERVHAVVETRAPLTPAVLQAFLADRLTPWKQPRSYAFTHERLRNDAGKVRRSQVREAQSGRSASVAGSGSPS